MDKSINCGAYKMLCGSVLALRQIETDRLHMDDLIDSKELKEVADVVIQMHNGISMGGYERVLSNTRTRTAREGF